MEGTGGEDYCSHLCKQSAIVNTEVQKRGGEEAEGTVSMREVAGTSAEHR